jgi:methionyl-tRNA formyltransferase
MREDDPEWGRDLYSAHRIDFFTGYDKSELLKSLLTAGVTVAHVVIPKSEKFSNASHAVSELAQQHQIEVLRVSKSDWSQIAALNVADSILLSARFPLKIPRPVFGKYLYALNVHPTLLPKYRGRYLEPILIAGDIESGVSLHLIDNEYDTGAIVHQVRFPVGRFDTINSLLRKASALELSLVLEGLALLLDPTFEPTLQNETEASSFFEKRTPDDSFVPCTASLLEALNVVRASNSVTHPAFTLINGEKVIIEMRRLNKPQDESDCI